MNGHRGLRPWFVGVTVVLSMSMLLSPTVRAAVPLAGSQGTDTSLPATASQTAVSGRDDFADLEITVNQTRNLTNQAVSITWTGGTPTVTGPGRFGSQYLQIMQCWGDDDGTVSGNPGPPPEQCVQGAVAGNYGGLPGGLYPSGFALSRVISRPDWPNFDPAVGYLDTRTTNVWMPFRAVDGTTVDIQTDPLFNPAVAGGNFWLNPHFNQITTNEIAGGVTGANGEGAELFQVLTGTQSSGLGCGQKSQPVEAGDKIVPKCWIVVVPRSSPAVENAGTPYEQSGDQVGVVTSPLAPNAWQNRIAIPIEFNPVDSPCALGADERRISGSELALNAVASWQPALCADGALPPFSYATVNDSTARQQLSSTVPGAPGMVVVSRPLTTNSAAQPIVYAPLSASGLVIAFNIERNPRTDAPAEAQALEGVRVADLNLTPRLVAKLLTQSYTGQINIRQPPNYSWTAANPVHLGLDPDFVRFNPEFAQLQIGDSRSFSGLQLPAGNSDAARQVWEWVFADPEARAWLNGAADPWGMRVNPTYATVAAANSTGLAFGDPVPNSFPKSDPYCYQAPSRGVNNVVVPAALCGTDWTPYSRGWVDAARATRIAADGARIVENPFAVTSNEAWSRELPQFLGRRAILSITDSPSAAQYGLQTARLSRAGDNDDDRNFIAPDSTGLAAGVASMAAGQEPQVLEPAPTAAVPDAYPLTVLTYAAIKPLSLDAEARADYSDFLAYVSIAGQVSGLQLGQLPRGYVPLPTLLQLQTLVAAVLVTELVPAPIEPDPTTTSTTATTAAPSEEPTTTSSTTSVPATVAPTPTTAFAPPASTAPRNTQPPVSNPPPSGTVPPVPTTPAAIDATATEPPVATDPPPTTTLIDVADKPDPDPPSIVTPFLNLAKSRYAVPGLGVLSLGSALGVLEVTKRPRRRLGVDGLDDADPDDDQPFEAGE